MVIAEIGPLRWPAMLITEDREEFHQKQGGKNLFFGSLQEESILFQGLDI